jgi:transposase
MRVDINYKTTKNGKTNYSYLLREAYRGANGKNQHKTIANLSDYDYDEVKALQWALKNLDKIQQIKDDPNVTYKSLYHYASVYVPYVIAQRLGIVKALGNTPTGKRMLWEVISRLIYPTSKLGSVRLAQNHAALEVLNMSPFNEDDIYGGLEWLEGKQEQIENHLFKQREEVTNLYLYDVTSAYLEGVKNELGAYGYDRDNKKGKQQIVVGLLTDETGSPLSVEVFEGNTQDLSTFHNQLEKIKQRFNSDSIIIVGDKGMLKKPQQKGIEKEGCYYITGITKAQIKSMLGQGAFQMSLFDENVKEIQGDDNERYVLRRNPVRAGEIQKTRSEKEEKVRQYLYKQNAYLRDHPQAEVSAAYKRLKQKIGRLKVAGWLSVNQDEERRKLSLEKDEEAMAEESKLDGCYVIKSDVPQEVASAQQLHDRYKDLGYVEQAFRSFKSDYMQIRPVYVTNEISTRAHVFIVMLSYMIERELAKCWRNENLTVREGIGNLAKITILRIQKGKETPFCIIPEGDETTQRLLDHVNIKLPPTVKPRKNEVYTRKTLKNKP